jgi:arsenite methyltransferase
VDVAPGTWARALQAAREAGFADIVDIRAGVFEDLPVEDASVDLVISNGVVNLSPEKLQVFREINRVLKPGGRLYLSDVVVERQLNMRARSNPDLWAACIDGALVKHEFEMLAKAVGLVGARSTEHFDCFRGASAEREVGSRLRVHGVNFVARKHKQED